MERDLLALRESAKAQQRTIFLAAQHSGQFESILVSNKATKSDIALRALMKRYQGASLSLDFADGPMIFRFPEHPAFRCDGETRVITARIKKISPISVHLEAIKYDDGDHDEIKRLGKVKQRIALLPPDPERKLLGMQCAQAMFDHRKIKLRVKTALDYLTERISHYEIQVGA